MSEKTGPGRPPKDGQFRKGKSGNPKGRPKADRTENTSAFDIVIDRMLTVTQSGAPREVTVEEALQLQTYKAAIAGKKSARREVLKMIAKREQYIAAREAKRTPRGESRTEPIDPDNADEAMLILGIAERNPDRQYSDVYGEQLLLEPWAVQAALSRRRGGEKLSDKEVAEIRRCTRAADMLQWPRGTGE